MVLRVPSVFTSDVIDKWPRFSEFLPQKEFEGMPGEKFATFTLIMLFILNPAVTETSKKIRCCKWDMIGSLTLGYDKVIFILLTEVVAMHMWFFMANVKKSNLHWTFTSFLKQQLFGTERNCQESL